MQGMIGTVLGGLASNRRARRRARNLRAGGQAPAGRAPAAGTSGRTAAAASTGQLRPHAGPARWLGIGALLLAIGGGILIAHHARTLAAAAGTNAADSGLVRELDAFQSALPGLSFSVPAQPGVSLHPHGEGALLVVANLRAERPVVIDLCEQMLDAGSGRISPVRAGYPFEEVAQWAARNASVASPVTLRNVVLSGAAMPRLDIAGSAKGGALLRVRWSGTPAARWIGDASAGVIAKGGEGVLGRQGWLVWGDSGALRVMRRASAACPAAGELVLQRWQPGTGAASSALVAAFPLQGAVRSATLAPGEYRVPAAAAPRLEDGALFDSLRAQGLVRLAPSGLIEVAPRDLARWRAADPGQRTADLRSWDGVRLDATGLKLLERLHQRADGAYVQEQVRVFNSERRLLAWRVRPHALGGSWQASAGPVAVAASGAMPLAAARLFDRLPQGWAPWSRIADWPAAAHSARLVLVLPRPARGGERIDLMLAGRVTAIGGARLADTRPACGGRACTRPDDVRELALALEPGARRLVLDAAPLDMAALGSGGDAAYRHLVLNGSALRWQPLPDAGRGAAPAPVPVLLADRHGAPLWQGGRPLEAAQGAGLATLLGVREGHANSIAGMLGRLSAPNGRPHAATLTLDLALQAAAQGALDCVGLRRGQWDGKRCGGGTAPAPGRQAGLVLLDTGSGDILAAASARADGAVSTTGAAATEAWTELRDFDRVDPARSPLRQAALQHDGGAERSPGSTYKIVSALGLELAAQSNPRLDALLDGMPLAAINAAAAGGGYAFRTDAATYPLGSAVHITNFRDQHLDRRAQDGKLGLSQALTYSLNTWFAWTAELADRSLLGKPQGGAPSLRALDAGALDSVRPGVAMARRLGFERPLRLDGGLLPPDYGWRNWDALQASIAASDPVGSRHALRQMAIGLRMQATPLHMALAAGAVGEGRAINPRLLLALDGKDARAQRGEKLGVRLDRIRAGLRGVVAHGTAAGAFRGAEFDGLRAGLYGKTGTAPVGDAGLATVWFTGWLEPGSIPGQDRRLAFAVFVSRSEDTGGGHAAPVAAGLLRSMLGLKPEQKGN